MKIVRLEAENIKRVAAVEIRPDGNIVEITGRNGAGKTSILDAIFWALAGRDAIQQSPIRRGEEAALIRLDLGTLKVTRKFRTGEDGAFTTAITVESAEGARFPSPQKMLDAIVGEIAFDPLGFIRMKPAEQVDTLRGLVPGVDFAGFEAKIADLYEQRRDAARRERDLAVRAAAVAVPEDAPEAEADESALVDELAAVQQHNAEIAEEARRRDKQLAEIDQLRTSAGNARAEADRLRREADALELEAEGAVGTADRIEAALEMMSPLPPEKSAAELRERIEAARRGNALLARRREAEKLHAEAEAAKAETARLAAALEAAREDKRAAIAAADLPVEGLGLDDDAVTLNGLPLAQASDAEQLACGVAIAAAMNPKLRVVRVRDGSLLDDASLAALAAFAAERDLQVWIETVASGRPSAIVIEDGRVAGAAEAAEPPTLAAVPDGPGDDMFPDRGDQP